MKRRFPARMAGEYAPNGCGASAGASACRTSGSLRDLAVSQAARANAEPPRRTVDDGPDRLQIRFEPTGTNVVGVGDGPADHRSSAADFAPLRHEYLAFRWEPRNCDSSSLRAESASRWTRWLAAASRPHPPVAAAARSPRYTPSLSCGACTVRAPCSIARRAMAASPSYTFAPCLRISSSKAFIAAASDCAGCDWGLCSYITPRAAVSSVAASAAAASATSASTRRASPSGRCRVMTE